MSEFTVCQNPDILRIIYFIKIITDIVKIIVPISLIVLIIIDCVKGVTTGEAKIGATLKLNGNRIISAILIFCIPTVVDIVFEIIDQNTNYESCWANATAEEINKYQLLWDDAEKIKEQEEEQEQVKNNNPEYTDSNSHTSSITGIKYILYNQCDSRWGSEYYNNDTICNDGCPMASSSVIISAYDANISPIIINNDGRGHRWPYDNIEYYSNNSFECSFGWRSRQDIINNLKDGNVVVIMVGEKSHFTSSYHYISLIDISDDESQIFVGNSYGSGTGTYNRNGWFDVNVVLTDIHEVHLCIPSQSIYDKFN